MKHYAKRYKEQGQVLIFAIVILIILLIATLFLFDLHSIIRSKIKLETAEQSAALAAAKWQARSLNLIGEINYVKAANTLLEQIPVYDENATDPEKVASANQTLTEMQTRISFCGPLIAFGAAQQAAKNNGVGIYVSDSQSGYKTVYNDLTNYLAKLDPASPYYNYGDISEYIGGYKWRDPYVNMLQLITEQGIAVRANGRFPGIESIDPPWLDDSTLYSAIHNETWCNPTLNSVIKYADSYFNGKWYNVDFEHTSFPNESEIYTLGIRFSGNVDPDILDNALAAVDERATDEELAPIRWCLYDSRWARYYADGVTENLSYDGPNNDGLENYWRRGMFLRGDLKPSMFYGGATAYAECYQYIKLMNKYKSTMLRPTGENDAYAASENAAKARLALQNNIVKETSSRTLKVGNDTSTDANSAGAVAKPLGALPNGSPPTDAIIVLPLFSDVSLIPSSMQSCRPLRVSFSYLEIFLIWLSSVEDLNNPETAPPLGTQQYLTALQSLDDPTFRKKGWNHAYTHSNADPATYFGDGYKYNSISNTGGAGWLQQVWVGYDSTRDEDASTELEEQAAGWNTRIYSGQGYILKDRNGNLVTNEQMQCRWTPGGPGPGSGPGTRIGPPHL